MDAYIEKLNTLEKKLSDKLKKKLHLLPLRRLIQKMDSMEDKQFESILDELFLELGQIKSEQKPRLKPYLKHYERVKKHVKATHGFVAKGSVVGEYTALGIGIGLVLGAGFSTFNMAMISIGLPIGLAVGLSLGSHKESELEKDGKLY